jgi:hypothetical protein
LPRTGSRNQDFKTATDCLVSGVRRSLRPLPVMLM